MEIVLWDAPGEAAAGSGLVSVMDAAAAMGSSLCCIPLWSSPGDTELVSTVGSIVTTGTVLESTPLIESTAGSCSVLVSLMIAADATGSSLCCIVSAVGSIATTGAVLGSTPLIEPASGSTSGLVSFMNAADASGSLLFCTDCVPFWSSPEDTGLVSAVGSITTTGAVFESTPLIEPDAGSSAVSTIIAAGSLLFAIDCAEPDSVAFGIDIISIGVTLDGGATDDGADGAFGFGISIWVCLIGSFSFFGGSGYGLGASGLIGSAGLLSRGRRRHLHLFTTTTVVGVVVGGV